jgi:hypothetical protein
MAGKHGWDGWDGITIYCTYELAVVHYFLIVSRADEGLSRLTDGLLPV